MLRVQHVQSVVLAHQDLRELLKVKLPTSHGEDCAGVGALEDAMHLGHSVLIDETLLEDDSMSDALHAVFDQELERIAVGSHEEVSSSHFSDDELDLEFARESLRFSQLHDGLFEMMVAWHRSDDDIDMRANSRAEVVQLSDKLVRVVSHALFDAWHLEIVRSQMLISEMLAQCVRESTFTATWDTCDQNNRDGRVGLLCVASQSICKLRLCVFQRCGEWFAVDESVHFAKLVQWHKLLSFELIELLDGVELE